MKTTKRRSTVVGWTLALVCGAGASACDSESSDPTGNGGGGKADENGATTAPVDTDGDADGDTDAPASPSCSDCEAELTGCQALAEDGASTNACLGAFAQCYVETTDSVIVCPEGDVQCEECLEHSTDQQSLIDMSQCILVDANRPELATCGADKTCGDCLSEHDACMAQTDDTASVMACLREFATCHVDTTGGVVSCGGDPDCEECFEHSLDRQSLIDMSECVLIDMNKPATCFAG